MIGVYTSSDKIAVLLVEVIQKQVVERRSAVPHMPQFGSAHVQGAFEAHLGQLVEEDAVDENARHQC